MRATIDNAREPRQASMHCVRTDSPTDSCPGCTYKWRKAAPMGVDFETPEDTAERVTRYWELIRS